MRIEGLPKPSDSVPASTSELPLAAVPSLDVQISASLEPGSPDETTETGRIDSGVCVIQNAASVGTGPYVTTPPVTLTIGATM